MPVAFIAAALLQGAPSTPSTPSTPSAPPPRLPKTFDIRTHWPTSAHRANIEGRAVVECKVKPDGVAHDCAAVSEAPAGLGFGVAAVRAYEGAKLEPGAPGAAFPPTARLPLNFILTPPAPYIRVVAHDGWAVVQQWERWRDFYPGKARGAGVSGQAEVKCSAREDGKVGCDVVSQTPEGHGFGEAALKIQSRLALSPPPGGAKATGRSVRTTVEFHAR